MESYLIPANSKKSMLILGFFNTVDLIVFGTGCMLTFVLILSIRVSDLTSSILILLPALITGFLVIPVPNQHNVRTMLNNIYRYFSGRRTYFWKGWCNKYGEESSK